MLSAEASPMVSQPSRLQRPGEGPSARSRLRPMLYAPAPPRPPRGISKERLAQESLLQHVLHFPRQHSPASVTAAPVGGTTEEARPPHPEDPTIRPDALPGSYRSRRVRSGRSLASSPPTCPPNTGDKLRSGARVQPGRRGHEAACPCWQPCRRKLRQLHPLVRPLARSSHHSLAPAVNSYAPDRTPHSRHPAQPLHPGGRGTARNIRSVTPSWPRRPVEDTRLAGNTKLLHEPTAHTY
jgi:hypothetical protein